MTAPRLNMTPGPARAVAGSSADAAARVVADAASPFRARPIGEILVSTGALSAANLDHALTLQKRGAPARIGSILVRECFVTENELAAGLALQQGVRQLRFPAHEADPALIDRIGADTCLRHGVLPWRQAGDWTIVATSRPQHFDEVAPILRGAFGEVRMAIGDKTEMTEAILGLRAPWLARVAEARPPLATSLRRWRPRRIGVALALGLLCLVATAIAAPRATAAALAGWSLLCLAAMTVLRLAAALSVLTERRHPPPAAPPDWPAVSILVPLLSEAEISAHLIDRLSELDYPEDRLDICLVVEQGDGATGAALASHGLPRTMRVIEVPEGTVRTKPRALNYALDFCRGEIVGVYDAEDAPDPDQLRRIAAAFHAAPARVVCLQGRLAFYNPHQNWLARCFAIDYAAWFGIVLPGLARLGFVVPLGGTTLFFRRAALEALGRWDAHNVTEDAELGLRLARAGWRTALVDTETREEANCHVGPWIRQRARWLKGYALTWAVHSRRPWRLLRDLGPLRFLGVQTLFLGTVSLFLLTPLLWTFWLVPFGFDHPLTGLLSPGATLAVAAFFIASEAVNLAVFVAGAARRRAWRLIPWVPTMLLYFPLAALASYRALVDIGLRPFFWDKTAHGFSLPALTSRLRVLHRVARAHMDGVARPAAAPRGARNDTDTATRRAS